MTDETFDKVVEERIGQIRSILAAKGKDYGRGDRLHQFKEAALRRHTTPEDALAGMAVKHDISVSCIVDDVGKDDGHITEKYINEKIGDAINYLILLEALIRERYGYVPKEKPGPGQSHGGPRDIS